MTPGTKLGPYEIVSAIGAGGMGEVYRAHDAKLGRDVALKVLPEAFARDAERMARFQREAKVLASLNHPNIATIHGLEDSGSAHALVMELVEGPTLADRIKQGPIPVDEAIRIARQVADALEYAHERGIVHRDLKPANVKVTSDDAVKVLDFGLAKAIEGDAASIDIATSPTMSRLATMQGVLLGTAAYMSPEQAKAKPVDRRADIWAFGCVLYEMLTEKMAFSGETVSDTLVSVIKEEPDWSLLPAATPIRVRLLLQRCLQKDAKQRLQAIGDARLKRAPSVTCARFISDDTQPSDFSRTRTDGSGNRGGNGEGFPPAIRFVYFWFRNHGKRYRETLPLPVDCRSRFTRAASRGPMKRSEELGHMPAKIARPILCRIEVLGTDCRDHRLPSDLIPFPHQSVLL